MKRDILKILKYIPLLLVALLLHFTSVAQLSVSITGSFEGCAPQILAFGCNVSGATDEVSYSWSSGNGDMSVLAEPTFSYLSPGRYTISVTIESGGQTATDSHEIVVFNGPTASFNDSSIVGCVSRGYLFKSSATEGDAEITSWLWYFGDGVSAQGRNRAHTYTSPGIFTVSLEVTDANGCRDEYHSQMLTLSKRPNVSISANDAQWCVAPHEVNFSSEISTDVGLGGPYTATWDFGDGSESNEDNPSHTYDNTGSYNVSLTVVDSYGCQSVVRKNNMVVIGTLTPTCTVPAEMCLNIPFLFRSDVDDDITCYWNFGDGTPVQSGTEASHSYSQEGNYSVTFTIDPNGPCRQTQVFNVNVVDVHASFRTEPEDLFSCTYPFEVRFISTSIGENLTYSYNFDDSYIGFDGITMHSYSQNGRFTPTLTVTSPGGCVSRYTGTEIVVNQPDASLHSTTAGDCVPATVGLYNDPEHTSNSAVVDFFWDFGDGTSTHTTTSSVLHEYSEFGIFPPTLTITDTSGCTATSILDDRPLASIITGTPVSPEQFGVTNDMHDYIPGDTICPTDVVYLYNSMSGSSADYNYFFVINSAGKNWDVNTGAEYTPYSFKVDTGWNKVGFTVEYRNCLSSVYLWDSVYVKPPIVHLASYSDCNAPFVYSFKITENLGAEYWEWLIWNTDNNNILMNVNHSTADSISFVFPDYGNYHCKLTAHNDGSDCEFVQEIVCAIRPPIFNWEISTDTLCLGNRLTAVVLNAPAFAEVAFDWEGRGLPINALEWIQINGITDSRYTYESGGNYEVIAYARQFDGCISVFTKQLYVVDPHSTISPTNLVVGCNPATFEFHNITNTDDAIYSATWNFGDGTENVSGENVTHTFEEAGIYDVSLSIMTWHGCQYSETFRNRVKVLDFPYAYVDFSYNVCLGTIQTFVSNESDNFIWHEWDFGDGTVISGTNSTLTHLYEQAGIYSFTHIVSVRGDGGAVCSDTLPCEDCINIERIVSADFTIDSSAYNCYPVSPTINTAIVTEPDYVNLRYHWDMGNGDILHVANPQYLYTAPGNYTINLEVTTYSGCSASMSHSVAITGPEANISLSDTIVCAGGEVHFSMTDAVDVESFMWVVGGGYNYYTEEVTHQYGYVPESGYFPVTLSIRNGNCMIDLTEQVYVYRINSDFSLLDLSGNAILEGTCSPLEGDLAYSGTNGVEQRWYVNGETYSEGTVIWTNSSTQTDSLYVVSLAITDSLGCIDSISHEYLVYKNPEVYTIGDTLICKGSEAHISVYGGNSYYWHPPIGNSTQSQIISPTEATIYYVDAFNEKMCMTTDSVAIDVFQPFEAETDEQSFTINIGDTAMTLVFSDMEALDCYISPAEYAFAGNCDTLLLYPLENTDFTLILKDTLGCYETNINIHVDVDIKYTLDVPGAFTPLSDDENSVVYVRGLGIKELRQFRIYNRWGEEVFFTNDLHTGWDGTISGIVQNMDTYSYYVEAEMYDGSIRTKKGNIMLLK
ncbi:MAG: PKD domain-containing protein [Bacteroidales bacterium]|nr:PKD domain-containing protein [Bacteroidales bacterium]